MFLVYFSYLNDIDILHETLGSAVGLHISLTECNLSILGKLISGFIQLHTIE